MSQGKRKRKGKGKSRRPVSAPARPEPEASEPEAAPDAEALAPPPAAPETRAEARRARRARRDGLEARQTALPVERERQLGRIVGLMALASTAMIFVAVAFATKASSEGPRQVSLFGGTDDEITEAEELQDYASHTSDQTISAVLQVGGILIAIAVGLFLYWMVTNRTTSVPRYVQVLAFVGPILFAAAVILVHLAMRDVSDAFVELPKAAQTSDRADDVKADSSLLLVAGIVDLVGRIAFAAWLGFLSREARNVELLTGFLGVFGIGAAFAIVLGALDVQIGLAMYVGWVASVGILALGRWPGGRPDGWQYRIDPSVVR